MALIFKFAFTNGIARYTVATGTSIFDGLSIIPGPKNWEVSFIAIIYFFEMVGFGGIPLFAGGWNSLEMWQIIRETYLPMAASNALGLVLFLSILRERGYEMVEHTNYLWLKRQRGEEMGKNPEEDRET